jgi:hypothetical protein
MPTTAVTETSDVADKDLVRAEREVAAITPSSLSPHVGHPVRISVGCGATIWGAEVI